MSSDGVSLNTPEARNAIGRWNGAADALMSAWSKASAKVDAVNSAQPWGDDDMGREFLKSYEEGGGTKITTDSNDTFNEVSAIGPRLDQAVTNSEEGDKQQAETFKKIAT